MQTAPLAHVSVIARDTRNASDRFTIPMRALIAAGKSTVNIMVGTPKAAPVSFGSALIVDGSISLHPAIVAAVKRDGCRLVYDFSDDVLCSEKSLATRTALGRRERVFDALTVSTQIGAAALREQGFDPVVIPTVIDPREWKTQPRRAPRARPRVGWYGRPLEDVDCGLVAQVVQAFMDAADFIFFGDVPPTIARVDVHVERVIPVPFALFPALLAAYDLDLILVPPAADAVRHRVTNVPLLQAGILGYPVIASDGDYDELNFTRVEKTLSGWSVALRDRLFDAQRRVREGERLRQTVHTHFAIERWLNRYSVLWAGLAPANLHDA